MVNVTAFLRYSYEDVKNKTSLNDHAGNLEMQKWIHGNSITTSYTKMDADRRKKTLNLFQDCQ